MSERAQLPGDLSLSRGAPTRRWMPILAAGLSIGQYARSVLHRVAALTAVLLVAIWALDGQGYLWPAWAWLGLAVPVLLDYTAGWAWRQSPGGGRLGGAREFWPAWALFGLAPPVSSYPLFALHDRVLLAYGRRALRARIDLLTRTRRQVIATQAAELRRIERD